MEHTTSEDSKPGTRFALNCEPARLMESADGGLDNGAGPDLAADEDTLSVESEEGSDEKPDEESKEETEQESDEESKDVLSARGAKLAFTLPRELVDHIIDLFDGYYYDGRQAAMRDLGSWSLAGRGYLSWIPIVDTYPKTDTWPWLHLLTTIAPAVPADKFGWLRVIGASEVPPRFGSSIYWGVPSAVSALPAPYRRLELRYIFASRLCKVCFDSSGACRVSKSWNSGSSHGTKMRRMPRSEMCHGMFRYCNFEPSAHTSSETGITTGWLSLDTGNHCAYLSFHYRQPIISCTVLISRDRDESNGSLNAFASHHLWRSLARLPNLRYLIVGLSDVDAVKVLAEKHQELWESLGKHLHYHHFASQPNAGQYKAWVGHDPVSLEQTDEKWNNNKDVGKSFTDKM